MRRRTPHHVPGHTPLRLFSAIETLFPRTTPGYHYGRWTLPKPAISTTPPPIGERAVGWPRCGGGLRVHGDVVEVPDDAEEQESKLTGLEKAAWAIAVAAAVRPPDPPDPEPPELTKKGPP